MNRRILFRAILCMVLLILPAGLELARGSQPTGSPEAVGASAGAAANAPWFNIEVDTPGDIGQYASVSVDPYTGLPYVSYYDATNKDLRVAFVPSPPYHTIGNCGPNNSWKCQTVDSEGDVGKYSSIAVILGVIHVAYHDASNGDLKYAESSDYPLHAIWRIRTIDKAIFPSSTGLHISVQLPSVGSLRVAYHLSNPDGVDALRYAYYVGGSGNCGYGAHAAKWQCDTIQTGEGVGQYTSLALDGDGNKHIAYYDAGNSELWYATSASGTNCGPGGNTWTCYPVSGSTTDVGQYSSLYVDDGGHFHIAYYDATNDLLKYAVDVGGGGNCGVLGSAQCDTIDDTTGGYHPLGVSIAEDAAGYPIIAYQSEYGSLNVARPLAALGLPAGGGNCGPEDLFYTWYCETIDPYGDWPLPPYRNSDFASIGLNSSGLATIAYYRIYTGPSDGNLMVSYQRFQDFLPLVMKNQ
jgi:hypothetical protein